MTMRVVLVILLLALGCARTVPEAPDGTAVGAVVHIDLSPMAYDGDAVMLMDTDAGERIRVLVPARQNLCNARGFELLYTLEPGDRVEVVGTPEADNAIRPCIESTHRIARVEPAS